MKIHKNLFFGKTDLSFPTIESMLTIKDLSFYLFEIKIKF